MDVLRVDFRLSQSATPGTPGSPVPGAPGIDSDGPDAKPLASDNLSPAFIQPIESSVLAEPAESAEPAKPAKPDGPGELFGDHMERAGSMAAELAEIFGRDEEGSSQGSPPESESDDEPDIKGVFFGDVELDDQEMLSA